MIKLLLYFFLSFFAQPETIRLTLENPSKQPLYLRIESFHEITIAPEGSSDIAMVKGEKIFGRKPTGDYTWKEFEILVVQTEHEGKVINAHKLYKKGLKAL